MGKNNSPHNGKNRAIEGAVEEPAQGHKYMPLALTEELLSIIAYGAPADATEFTIQQAERLLTASRLLSKTMNKTLAVKMFMKHTGVKLDMARRYVNAAEQYLGEVQPIQKNALREMLKEKHMRLYREAVEKYKKNEAENPAIAIKYLEMAERNLTAISKVFDLKFDRQPQKTDTDLSLPTILLTPELPPPPNAE